MSEGFEGGLTVIDGGKLDEEGDKPVSVLGSRTWATKTRRRAKELSKTLDLGYMELARILYQIYDAPIDGDPQRGPIYTAWGYNNFAEYAEQELDIHSKKAERLRRIWYLLEIQLKDMDLATKQRIVNLGLSKVRELVRVLTIRNAEQWVEQAETMTYRKLLAAIGDELRRQGVSESFLASDVDAPSELGTGPNDSPDTVVPDLLPPPEPPPETVKQERFDLFPAQLENVRLALTRASQLSGSEKKGHCLDLICTDFIATNDVIGSDDERKLRYIAKIERLLGLKLIVVDPGANEIVYGLAALQSVAAAGRSEEG